MAVGQRVEKMTRKNQPKVQHASAGAQRTAEGGFWHFFGEVKAELRRITWTGKEELQLYTKIVVVATFALGMAIYASDLVIQSVLSGLGAIFRLIAG